MRAALFPNAERHLRLRMRLAQLYPPAARSPRRWRSPSAAVSRWRLRYEYPAELVPEGETAGAGCEADRGRTALALPAGVPPKVAELVEHELRLIAELGYEPFFLTVHDVVRFARGQGILCQGRGSAANSVVCYALASPKSTRRA